MKTKKRTKREKEQTEWLLSVMLAATDLQDKVRHRKHRYPELYEATISLCRVSFDVWSDKTIGEKP